MDAANFLPAETAAVLKPHRAQLELRNLIFMFHMDVDRFIPVTGIEEESIGPFQEYSRHAFAPESRRLRHQGRFFKSERVPF